MEGVNMVTQTKYTLEQATSFKRYSPINTGCIKTALTCGCEPYQDVFTYNRWKALGYQVQRGEKSITIPVIHETEDEETKAINRRLWKSHVFCRCQVAEIGTKPTPVIPQPPVIQPPVNQEPKTQYQAPAPKNIMEGWKVI